MTNTVDKGYQGFLVPEMAQVQKVEASHIFIWLSKGWDDLKALNGVSLPYATVFLIVGLIISFGFYHVGMPYLVLPSLSGFLLVGPAIAIGFYEGSLRRQRGESFTFTHAIFGFRRNSYPVLGIGLAQVFLFMVWIRLSFTLFAVAFPGVMPDWGVIFERAASWEGVHFAFMITVLGAVFASLIFFTGAFSLPLMIDRKTVLIPAMLTSAYAVYVNRKAMILWAALIVAIMAIGLISVIGLIITFPLIGHATWHAYQDIFGDKD